jgi:hypothetical protein
VQGTAAAAANPPVDAQAEADKILAEAQAKAAQIVADAEAQAKAKSDKSAVAAAEPDVKDGEQLVSIRLFKDNDKYKDDVFVAVNGERIQIKRGETVRIKKKFADVLEESMKQDMATANMIERESSEFEAKAAALKL